MNHCDHGHETGTEIRVLPHQLADNDCKMRVCQENSEHRFGRSVARKMWAELDEKLLSQSAWEGFLAELGERKEEG